MVIKYLRVGLDCGDEKPTYSFNLRDALEDYLTDLKENLKNGHKAPEFIKKISSEFRKFADELEGLDKP